jgi:hypothetical protein
MGFNSGFKGLKKVLMQKREKREEKNGENI